MGKLDQTIQELKDEKAKLEKRLKDLKAGKKVPEEEEVKVPKKKKAKTDDGEGTSLFHYCTHS